MISSHPISLIWWQIHQRYCSNEGSQDKEPSFALTSRRMAFSSEVLVGISSRSRSSAISNRWRTHRTQQPTALIKIIMAVDEL